MKRLRKNTGAKIRYYHCGEYGPKFGRPHYHAILFGFDFPDRQYLMTKNGHRLYTSEMLDCAWQSRGFSTVGNVTFESAAYVARYIMKKVTGDQASDHYWKVDELTGEAVPVQPEYTTMSRRPGIASAWLQQFSTDVYPSDEIVIRGRKMRPPRFYDSQFEIEDPAAMEEIKLKRKRKALKHADNNTPERLAVRERVKRAQIQQLKRGYENEA